MRRRRAAGGRTAPAAAVLLAPAVLTLTVLAALAACHPTAGTPRSRQAPATPATESPCAAVPPTPTAAAVQTKLPWRAETMPDGSITMTVGDIDAAPRTPGAARVADYRAPGSETECADVRIVTVHGWWCATTVAPIAEQGEIVVGGASPRARLRAAGFRTHCAGRTARMRQHYEFQRDSWSGWRPYDTRARTPWTTAPNQSGAPAAAPCPQGRVGTYDYRLGVAVEIEGYRVDDATAASAPVRTDCGTGAG